MLDLLTSPEAWASLLTLTVLEIVLGIDNIIFLSIVAGKLPVQLQAKARRVGLMLALIMRVVLLSMLAWLAHLTEPLVTFGDHDVSWRDIILLGGGLFLMVKGTSEIHETMDVEREKETKGKTASFSSAIAQIVVLDVVFSLDSVITAIGMSNDLPVMIAAVVIAILIMLFASEPVGKFVNDNPSIKMLALSFLLLVGMALVADGLHFHIPRGYLYFSVAFSLSVEVLNLTVAKRSKRKVR